MMGKMTMEDIMANPGLDNLYVMTCGTIAPNPAELVSTQVNENFLKEAHQEYDFVIDGTDNFESKFLIADICSAARIPYSHGGVLGFLGQTMTVIPGKSTCYRCIFRQPPEHDIGSIPAGPLGTVPGVIGTLQATEAIKFIIGIGKLLINRLLIYDALTATFREVRLARDKNCPVCGRRKAGKHHT